jgi:hypothetical protein
MREFQISATSVIDAVQSLQRMSANVDNTDARMRFIMRSFSHTGASGLLGRPLMIDSSLALGYDPDNAPDTRTLFQRGLLFSGVVSSYNYMVDERIPLNDLAICFEDTSLVRPGGAEQPVALSLQVPVLAIRSCVDISW